MKKLFIQPTPAQISSRLREIRRQRGWSLADVERESSGSIKAVVMGSYERGTRSLSIKRTLELAELFDLPINDLLNPSINFSPIEKLEKAVLDLRKVNSTEDSHGHIGSQISYFISSITRERGDWNGEILTIRSSDIRVLALMAHTSEAELLAYLKDNSILVQKLK